MRVSLNVDEIKQAIKEYAANHYGHVVTEVRWADEDGEEFGFDDGNAVCDIEAQQQPVKGK